MAHHIWCELHTAVFTVHAIVDMVVLLILSQRQRVCKSTVIIKLFCHMYIHVLFVNLSSIGFVILQLMQLLQSSFKVHQRIMSYGLDEQMNQTFKKYCNYYL